MSFIRVLGEDKDGYAPRKAYQWIRADTIVRAYPLYAVKSVDGALWRATADTDGSERVSWGVDDLSGESYSCGDEAALRELGIDIDGSRGPFGFVQCEEESLSTHWDLIKPIDSGEDEEDEDDRAAARLGEPA